MTLPSSTLDEKALRRPNFVEGAAVKLWDGQEWILPKPSFAGWYPRRNAAGQIEASTGYNFGPDYDALLDAYLSGADGLDFLGHRMAIAAYLLITNYDIADADLPLVLYQVPGTDPRHDANAAMWEAITDVALGRDPKPTAVGSDSPSLPTASTSAA